MQQRLQAQPDSAANQAAARAATSAVAALEEAEGDSLLAMSLQVDGALQPGAGPKAASAARATGAQRSSSSQRQGQGPASTSGPSSRAAAAQLPEEEEYEAGLAGAAAVRSGSVASGSRPRSAMAAAGSQLVAAHGQL